MSRALAAALAASFLAMGASPGFAAEDDDEGDVPGTIVPTRAPEEKTDRLVRNKYFVKKGRIELTPQFGFVVNNALNQEPYAGFAATYHFTEGIGLEVGGNYAFLGGASNGKPLARAVLRLVSENFSDERIESVDPGLFTSVSGVFSPLYGKINPFGLAVINVDFFFLAGLGYGMESVEVLGIDPPGQIGTTLQLASARTNHLFQVNLGVGVRVFATKWFSLRVDGRAYISYDKILDYSTPENAATNRSVLGSTATRLDCDGDLRDQVYCTGSLPTAFVVNIGASFWAPGDAKARGATASRR